MLPNSLTTNEVKNSAGVEVEFDRLRTVDRTTEFAQKSEVPARPHRLKIAHQEIGVGIKARRRSVIRIDKSVVSDVDATLVVTPVAQLTLDAPVGALTSTAELKNVLAELMSFLANTGADTTIMYDCTGSGAAALVNGTL